MIPRLTDFNSNSVPILNKILEDIDQAKPKLKYVNALPTTKNVNMGELHVYDDGDTIQRMYFKTHNGTLSYLNIGTETAFPAVLPISRGGTYNTSYTEGMFLTFDGTRITSSIYGPEDLFGGDGKYLKLDQTDAQTVDNGTPIFDDGLNSNGFVNIGGALGGQLDVVSPSGVYPICVKQAGGGALTLMLFADQTQNIGELSFTSSDAKAGINFGGLTGFGVGLFSNYNYNSPSLYIDATGLTNIFYNLYLNCDSATALVVEQSGVHDDVLVVDTYIAKVSIGGDLDITETLTVDHIGEHTPPSTVSHYPPVQNDTYVKATTYWGGTYYPYMTTDPTQPLTGGYTWISGAYVVTNQRFHIDLGSGHIINKIYYENGHYGGEQTDIGAQNFTFWGSNEASAFAELTYGTDTDWTQLTTSQSTFDIHASVDAPDPKYITVTNTTSYRYYAFKFADNWGASTYIGVRRIELQIVSDTGHGVVFDNDVTMGTLGAGAITGTSLTDGTATLDDGALTSITTISMSGQLTNTLAIGTSPFAVTSTTVNTNLNADLWDGYQFADYLDQAVKTTSSPQFALLGIGGAAVGNQPLTVVNAAATSGSNTVLIDQDWTATGSITNSVYALKITSDKTSTESSSYYTQYGLFMTVNDDTTGGGSNGSAYGGHVSVDSDQSSVGCYGWSGLCSGLGDNYAIYADAVNGTTNYSFYGARGIIYNNDKIVLTQTDGNEYIDSLNDGYVDIGATTAIRLKQISLLENALYFTQTDGAEKIDSDADGDLDYYAGTSHDFIIGATEQITLTDGVLAPTTDSDVDLGTSSLYFKNAFIDAITCTGNIAVNGGSVTATGDLTLDPAGNDVIIDNADLMLSSQSYYVKFGSDDNVWVGWPSSRGTVIQYYARGELELAYNNNILKCAGVTIINMGGTAFDPAGTGLVSSGTASNYWNDISYKTITDRGCLGCFDDGVELQDGSKVTDVEAIKAIKVHPSKKTVYGVPMFDYRTFPKVSYKPASDRGRLLPRDEKDEPYLDKEYVEKKVGDEHILEEVKVHKPASDGVEMTSMFSIMLGAIKELDARLAKLEVKE